ncbi:hypothetical protein PMAYCL1PPCAC_28738, partial [Pristionchus mayeri]
MEMNCPPDWYCYKFEKIVEEDRNLTMGCTKYPWRIPVKVKSAIFKEKPGDDKSETTIEPLRVILSPDMTVLDNDRIKYCATRDQKCEYSHLALYMFEPAQLLGYLDWFEGAKHYLHYHADRIAEIAEIVG